MASLGAVTGWSIPTRRAIGSKPRENAQDDRFDLFRRLRPGKESEVTEVAWDGPAFKAGLTVGSKLIAVNSRALEIDQLKAAIKAKKSPLSLLVKTGDIYRTIELNYNGGLRYPKLEKTGTGGSMLESLLAPKP